MEDLKLVLDCKIPAGAKILWAKIYLLVGYKAFMGAQSDVAALFGLKHTTFKLQLSQLKKVGAISVRSRYNNDRSVQGAGSRFELTPPDLWLIKVKPV